MKRALTLVAALALTACGAAPRPAVETASEIPVVMQPSSAPVVELRLVFRAGSAFDPPGREGAAQLLAALMTDGGTAELTYAQFLDRLYPWAASIRAQVDREQLVFVVRCPREHFDAFYPVLRDVLLTPRMGEEDFNRLRQKTLDALTRDVRTQNDEELSKMVLESVLFAGTPYAHPEIGTEAALRAGTLADLKAHRQAVLTRDRLVIGAAGAVDQALVDRLRADLAALPAKGAPISIPEPPAPKRRLVVVEQPEAPATALSFGHVITPTRGHADFPALALAASYFGEHRQFQGVMFQRMRELRGMNYGDYAYAEAFSQEGWSRFALTNIARTRQHFSLWIRPVPNEDRHFAARITMYLLNEMLEKGLTPAQFEETRAFLNGYLYLQQQTDQRRLGTAIDDRFYGLSAPYADGLRAAWAKLDAAGVNDALRRNIHPEALTVVVITPNAQAFVDAVLAETPSPKTYPAEKPAALLEEDKVIEVLPLGFTREQVEIIPSSTLFAR